MDTSLLLLLWVPAFSPAQQPGQPGSASWLQYTENATPLRNTGSMGRQAVSDTQINTAVALLKARDETIAALSAAIREKDITIRHLLALLEEADNEVAAAQALANDSFFGCLPD
jgi:hypothetical protein